MRLAEYKRSDQGNGKRRTSLETQRSKYRKRRVGRGSGMTVYKSLDRENEERGGSLGKREGDKYRRKGGGG